MTHTHRPTKVKTITTPNPHPPAVIGVGGGGGVLLAFGSLAEVQLYMLVSWMLKAPALLEQNHPWHTKMSEIKSQGKPSVCIASFWLTCVRQVVQRKYFVTEND